MTIELSLVVKNKRKIYTLQKLPLSSWAMIPVRYDCEYLISFSTFSRKVHTDIFKFYLSSAY